MHYVVPPSHTHNFPALLLLASVNIHLHFVSIFLNVNSGCDHLSRNLFQNIMIGKPRFTSNSKAQNTFKVFIQTRNVLHCSHVYASFMFHITK